MMCRAMPHRPDRWQAFDEVLAVLGELRARGVRTVIPSTLGLDLARPWPATGLARAVDADELSLEAGPVKRTRTSSCLRRDDWAGSRRSR